MNALVNILVLAASVLVVTRLVPGIRCKDFGTAVFVALGISVLNFLTYKLLFFLAVPFILLTGFLGYFLINAFILNLVDKMVDGFEVRGMGNLLLGSTLISLVNWLLSHVVGRLFH